MAFLIGGANSATGYEIDNSLRFNQSDHCLTKTFGSGGDRKKWTFSVWFKRSNLITSAALFVAGSSGQAEGTIRLESHKINWQEYDGSSMDGELLTNQVLRDVSAWYHLVCVWDSANATAGNRMRIYLNGSEITSFATDNNPTLNYDSQMNNNVLHNIGRQSWNNASDFDGYMADVNFIDGEAYDSSYFGETNDNGVWIPKKYDGSYGDTSFFLEFQQTGTDTDASGIGADTSGETNHWAINNLAAGDITTDTPTNNFCTYNPLDTGSGSTFSEGNLATNTGDNKNDIGTIGFENGKWYWEVKAAGSGVVGVQHESVNHLNGTNLNDDVGSVAYSTHHGIIFHNNNSDSSPSSDTDGCIIGCAVDMDNNKIYWHKDGTYIDTSGGTQNPTTAANPITVATGTNTSGFWFPKLASGSSSQTYETNFGNPNFSISSGNADANGYGNFEYAVPSGYYSLCTKNLAEFG